MRIPLISRKYPDFQQYHDVRLIEESLSIQPSTSYLICGTQRSGSTLLCEALTNSEIAGYPEEYFLPQDESSWQKIWNTLTYEEYLAAAFRQGTTPNGIFGAKLMWSYFGYFIKKLQKLPGNEDIPAPKLLDTVFPDLHYIWIKRKNKVRQAISHARASQTNIWISRSESSSPSSSKLKFSFSQIDFMVHLLEAEETSWQRYFTQHNIQPLEIVYEDFIRSYEKTAIEVLRYLGLDIDENFAFAPRRMKVQSDRLNDQWEQSYYALKENSVVHRLISQATKLVPLERTR